MSAHFLLGLITSFLGSLPLGIISIAVVEITINRHYRQGVITAAGIGFVEFFQALLAIAFLSFFAKYPLLLDVIYFISIPIFLVFAFNHLKSDGSHKAIIKQKDGIPEKDPQILKKLPLFMHNSFIYGAFISSLNVVVYPFWIISGGEFMRLGILKNDILYIFFFAFGVSVGTTLGMILYVAIGTFFQKKLKQYNYWMNSFVGIIFLGLALLQIWNLLTD